MNAKRKILTLLRRRDFALLAALYLGNPAVARAVDTMNRSIVGDTRKMLGDTIHEAVARRLPSTEPWQSPRSEASGNPHMSRKPAWHRAIKFESGGGGGGER